MKAKSHSRPGRILEGVVEEEVQRQEELLKRALVRIRALPAGSLQVKARGGRKYGYLAFRDDGRVHYRYVGPVGSEAVSEVRASLAERRKLQAEAKRHEQAIADIRKRFRV